MTAPLPAAEELLPGQEYPPVGEAEAIEKMTSAFAAAAARPAGPAGMALRQGHSFMHGCVSATFEVEADLPAALRLGVFKSPIRFPAWVRLSNASAAPVKTPDGQPDQRGMAIKLMNVPGDKILTSQEQAGTQDFSLLSQATFTSRNVAEFLGFVAAVTSPDPADAGAFFGDPANAELVGRLMSANQPCADVLGVPYWSTTPYRFGDTTRAVKYHVRPSQAASLPAPTIGDNYLRENLARTLSEREVRLHFCAQFQEDAATMPIEDPTVEWRSPFIKLATITLPIQQFDTPQRDAFGEALSFNPWHSLPEHRPLGGINRARKSIYDAMVALRQQQNQRPVREPSADAHNQSMG